jgi:hypothetical protein
MKWAPWLCGSLAVAVIAACGGERRHDSNTTGDPGAETGTMQGGTGTPMDTTGAATTGTTDTAHTGAHSDSAAARTSGTTGASGISDSARGNQTESGVTNTKTGKSTLGPGVTQTRSDQNEPVTSKGDTIGSSPDSSTGSNR